MNDGLTMVNNKRLLHITVFIALLTISAANTEVIESLRVFTYIRYRYATTTFTEVIRNTASSTQGIGFSVQLPKEAFIVDFSMTTNGKTYKGQIMERTVISQTPIVGSRPRQPQASRNSNRFEVVLDVSPGANATFTLTYTEMLKREHGIYEHQVHLSPGQVVQNFIVEVFIRENKDLISVSTPALRKLGSESAEGTNQLARINRPASELAQIMYAPTMAQQRSIGLDHTFVVQYDVEHSQSGDIIVVDGYFFHFFAPDETSLPKDIIFVLDISGSMSGNKLTQMQDAMRMILGDLQSQDRFNIVPFSSSAHQWERYMVSVNRRNIYRAKQYVDSLSAWGGTNIYGGIMKARYILKNRRQTSGLSMIFFLTDGQDPAEISVDTSIPIFGLAFGDDADYAYIKALSSKNEGFADKIHTDITAASQVASFYDRISSVSYRDVKFKYNPDIVDESSLTNTEFPFILKGTEAVVTGRVKENVTKFESEISVVGISGKVKLDTEADDIKKLTPPKIEDLIKDPANHSIPSPQRLEALGSMKRTYAHVKIQELLNEDEKHAKETGNTENLDEVLELSVENGLGTKVTSVVVSDPDTGEHSESVVQNEEEQASDSRTVNFIKSRPPTTTTSTTTTTTTMTTTTTPMPWCPPQKSVDDALKSNFLTQTNFSSVLEMCLGISKNSFRYLRAAMGKLGRIYGVPKREQTKQYDSKNETSHMVKIDTLSVTDGQNTVCVSTERIFEKDSSYALLESSDGTSLYLLTGWNSEHDVTTTERLILNSSLGHLATVFLGASTVWRVTGDAEFTFEVKSEYKMSITLEEITVDLRRDATEWSILYRVTVSVAGGKGHGAYGGILGERLQANIKATRAGRNNHNPDGYNCVPLAYTPYHIRQYKIPPFTFLSFYLDFLLDLKKNLPTKSTWAMLQDELPIPPTYLNDHVVTTPTLGESAAAMGGKHLEPKQKDRNLKSREERSIKNDNSSLPDAISSIVETAVTSNTTTTKPACRQRKSVEKATKSTFLKEVEISQVTEMCMGMNEQPFKTLWDIMGILKRLENRGVSPKHQTAKEDHAGDEVSRMTLGQYFTVSDDAQTVCVGPRPNLKRDSMYKLMEAVEGEEKGVSLYLVTGWNKEHGVVTWERLILNNTFDVATIFLGTTAMWRIFGSLTFTSKVKGQHEITISAGSLEVTLRRQVTEWNVLYTIGVRVEVLDGWTFGGLLWDIHQGDTRLLGFQESNGPRGHGCYPLSVDQRVMKQYTTSPLAFTYYFIDFLFDLSKNLPPHMFA